MKAKIYKMVEILAIHCLEIVALRKRQEAELEVAEVKRLRLFSGVMWMDRIGNEYTSVGQHM